MNAASIWGSVALKDEETLPIAIGALRLWMKHRGPDCFFLFDQGYPADGALRRTASELPPADGQWTRMGGDHHAEQLTLHPLFPNRAVVVRPKDPYLILPGQKVQFFVGVPLWVGLSDAKGIVLVEEPVTRLSNTWFGKPTEGELAYAIRSNAVRDPDELEPDPWRVTCPVRIRNLSSEPLMIERLLLRVPLLTLYADPNQRLWANESGMTYRGRQEWSRMSYGRGAPSNPSRLTPLREPRMTARSTFSLWSASEGGS